MSESVPNAVEWMDEALQIAAQCWCDEETKDRVMDPVLAKAVAKRIAAWMQTGAQHARNETYWRERALAAEALRPNFDRLKKEPVMNITKTDALILAVVGIFLYGSAFLIQHFNLFVR